MSITSDDSLFARREEAAAEATISISKTQKVNKSAGRLNALESEGGGVNTVKTLTFEKGRWVIDPFPPPPTSYGGAAPACGSNV